MKSFIFICGKKRIKMLISVAVIALVCAMFYGCGQSQNSGGSGDGTTADYTISGKTSLISTNSLRAAGIDEITHIVAIRSNGDKYSADFNSTNETFSVKVYKGVPYALGFYNKSGNTITLLGYLKQSDYNWHTLPIINPTGEALDLGTVEVNSGSVEAKPSVDVTSLIAQMNMTPSTAQYYGNIDESLVVFTNIDVNGNGQFDFEEGKSYLFSTFINMSGSGGSSAGQIPAMLNGNYNDSYTPSPSGYTLTIGGIGDSVARGSLATFHFPQPVSNTGGTTASSITVSPESNSAGNFWSYFSKMGGNPIVTPEVAPSGTYTVDIAGNTYTFKNYSASELIKIGSNDGIIYPIFNIVTSEAGYITKINYKWKKLIGGAITDPTSEEVRTIIEDTSKYSTGMGSTLVHSSPWISLRDSSGNSLASNHSIAFDRDGSSVDISSHSIRLSDLHYIQASYNLTSRVVCKFDLGL